MVPLKPLREGAMALRVRSVAFLLLIGFLSGAFLTPVHAETSYGIHIASYQDLDEAVSRVNYLKRLGYGAFYRYETVPKKGKWYRIYIARYPTLTKAKEEARALQALDLIQEFKIRRLENGGSAPTERSEPTPPPPSRPGSKAEAAPPADPGDTVFLLHVSSFKEKEHAVEEVVKLEKAGQKAFFVDEELAGGRWFRVYIGKYETEKEARAAGEALKDKGLVSYFKPLEIDRSALSGPEE